jgi:hypothetical protein
MKILILHMFIGPVLLMGSIGPPARHKLSRRLTTLRFRPYYQIRQIGR